MIKIDSEAAMLAFGNKLANACENATVIYLSGPLGAGKTTFARGFLQGLGYQGHVKSPTYTLVEPYQCADQIIYHFDLYRIHDPEELHYIGLQDYSGDTCLIEWPEQGGDYLPPPDLTCYIKIQHNHRHIELFATTEKGKLIVERLAS